MEPDVLIAIGMARTRIQSNSELAKRIGLVRQTLSHKRKYPSTFTCGEISSMAKVLNWSNEDISDFIRGI